MAYPVPDFIPPKRDNTKFDRKNLLMFLKSSQFRDSKNIKIFFVRKHANQRKRELAKTVNYALLIISLLLTRITTCSEKKAIYNICMDRHGD